MSYRDRIDPRFGPMYPDCSKNKTRVTVRLDFGLGSVFTVEYQSRGVARLLRAVAKIRAINESASDPRTYKVHAAGHRTHGGYDVTVAGTYACRPINNPNHPGSEDPSPHSEPCAIDINPATNGWDDGRGDIPEWVVEAFRSEGLTWGGEWGDAMHFERLEADEPWDGTYPEEDELTPEEKDTLQWAERYRGGRQAYHDGKRAPRKGTPERGGYDDAKATAIVLGGKGAAVTAQPAKRGT